MASATTLQRIARNLLSRLTAIDFDVTKWEQQDVDASTSFLTERETGRTLTVVKDEPSSDDCDGVASMVEYHRKRLAHATYVVKEMHGKITTIRDGGHVVNFVRTLKTVKKNLEYLEMHTTPWLESGEYTREKIEHDGELLKFPPLPLLDDVLAELRVQHPLATSSLRPPGKSSSQRTPARRTTRSASKRPRENDTDATPASAAPASTPAAAAPASTPAAAAPASTPAAAAPASTTPDNPEGPLSTRQKRQRGSPDVQAGSPVPAESPAEVSPDHRADDMSHALAMVNTRFDKQLELEKQVSDHQKEMQQQREDFSAEMTALKESMQQAIQQEVQQAIQALRTELQNQPGPSVQQRPVTGAANAASAPAAGADVDFFAKAIDNQKKENGGKKMTTVHEGEAFGVCIYHDFRDEVGMNLFLALNDNRGKDGRYLLNYALFKNETQQKLFPIPGSKKHVWSLATSLAPSKWLTLKSILEGELYVQHTNRLEGMLPAPVAVQPPDNASQRQTAQPTPRTKAIAKMTETMQENNSMMRRFGQYLGFRSPMAKGTTMPPPSPRQVRLSPLGMNQGDAAIAQQSPRQAKSPTLGGATTQPPRSGSRTSGDNQRKSPETRATAQRSRSGSRTSGGKRKSPQSGDKRKGSQTKGDKQSVLPRRSERLSPQYSLNAVPTGHVESNDLRGTPRTPIGSGTWVRD